MAKTAKQLKHDVLALWNETLDLVVGLDPDKLGASNAENVTNLRSASKKLEKMYRSNNSTDLLIMGLRGNKDTRILYSIMSQIQTSALRHTCANNFVHRVNLMQQMLVSLSDDFYSALDVESPVTNPKEYLQMLRNTDNFGVSPEPVSDEIEDCEDEIPDEEIDDVEDEQIPEGNSDAEVGESDVKIKTPEDNQPPVKTPEESSEIFKVTSEATKVGEADVEPVQKPKPKSKPKAKDKPSNE